MDPIADALIRIKNGYLSRKVEVNLSYSKLTINLCELLSKKGFIEKAEKLSDREIKVTLKYKDRLPVLTDVKRVSKPGRRVYCGSKKLPRVLNGLGLAVISTPKGLMSDKEARKAGLGGEIMAFVW
jgi:small subunit ribosomal protein S8